MPIEPATYIDGLNPSNPPSGDSVGEGDDHLRLIKSALKNTFPNIFAAVTATAAELNQLSGTIITSFAKLLLASPSAATAIATLVAPGASGNVMTSTGTTWISAPPSGSGGQIDIQTFDYTGGDQTWTKPSFGTIAIIECWGGGGSGAKLDVNEYSAGGGGGGNYVMRILPLSALNATETVYVGAGGAAAGGATANGNDGQNTTFGSHVIAHGGGKGFYYGRGGGGGAAGTDWHQGRYGGGNGGGVIIDTVFDPIGGTFGGGGGSGEWDTKGADSMYGGAGGGAANVYSGGKLGGTSLFGGNGGNGAYNANAQAGSVPGGGGGACFSFTPSHISGAGGHGRCRVTVF